MQGFIDKAKVENLSQGDLISRAGDLARHPWVSFHLPSLSLLSLAAVAWLLTQDLAAVCLGPG